MVPRSSLVAIVVAFVACATSYDPADDTVAPPPPDSGAAEVDASSPRDAADAPDAAAAPPADAGPPWKLYATSPNTPSSWTSVDLDAAWTGPNAPPPRGIRAITQLTVTDRLLVFADDGRFYTRVAGEWQPPRQTAEQFPLLAGRDFRGVYHQPNYPTTGVEELTFVENPLAFLYTYSKTGAVNLEQPPVTMQDEPGPYGAPKGSKKCRWVTRSWNLGVSGAGLLTEYSGYDGDPNVYLYDGTPQPAGKWPFAEAPLFKNKTGVPDRERVMAAWRDDALETTYLIVR